MIIVEAAAYEDGYAIVRNEESLFLIRPPYLTRNMIEVSESVIEKAVSQHGFSLVNESFDNWAAVIEFLRDKFLEKRRAIGQTPDSSRIRQLIERAPSSKALEFLNRVNDELLPRAEYRAATGILVALLNNDAVREDARLLTMCTELMAKCEKLKEQQELARMSVLPAEEVAAEEFALAADVYGNEIFELAKRIREDKQVLVVGSF